MVLAFALWVGVPIAMVFRNPDRHPRFSRVVPAYLRHHPDFRHHPAVAPVGVPAQARREQAADIARQDARTIR